ncbi:unnamed protein product [Prorocentrum cordatum]|uniref:Uncharacterized protein n=1 Tax=Prorocentrum cordatum TaxID=2364126 RepID=A0ABN9R7F5_9DINO|nr:unnamed protein product [Polarella glacialis]CAK0814330.1 unnamed protein product [Polarella glacialis]
MQDTLRLAVGLPLVLLLHGLAVAPAVLALEALHEWCGDRRAMWWLLAPVLFRHLTAFSFVALTVLQKRAVVGRLGPGPLPSKEQTWASQWDAFRSWLHEQAISARMYDTAADMLVGTEGLSVIYRLLGMKVGRRVQIDNFFCADPDCVIIEDDVVFGSVVSVWCQSDDARVEVRFHRGCNVLDHCCVLSGSRIGERAVLGSATLAPQDGYFPPESISTGQVGGKPVRLRFQAASEEASANEREAMRRLNSDVQFWGFNMVLAGCALVCAPLPQYVWLATYALHGCVSGSAGWLIALAVLPIVFFAVNLSTLCLNWALKWCLVGRYEEGDYAFFSRYHIIWMAMLIIAGAMEDTLDALAGTLFKAWYYRAMGATVGKNCCLFGLAFEYDLLHIGDCSSVGWECDTTCHTVENMVIKLVPTYLGAYTSMLSHSMVSPGAVTGDGSVVLENSQVLKGEQVPPDEVWAGLPATSCGRAGAAAVPPGPELFGPQDADEPPSVGGGPGAGEIGLSATQLAEGPSVEDRRGLAALEVSAVVAFPGAKESPRFLVERTPQGALRLWCISDDGRRLQGRLRVRRSGEVDLEGKGGRFAQFVASADPEGDPGRVALQGVGTGRWLCVDRDMRFASSAERSTVALQQLCASSQVLLDVANRAKRRLEEQRLYFEHRRQQAAYAAATGSERLLKGKSKGKGKGKRDADNPAGALGLRFRKGGKAGGKGSS